MCIDNGHQQRPGVDEVIYSLRLPAKNLPSALANVLCHIRFLHGPSHFQNFGSMPVF